MLHAFCVSIFPEDQWKLPVASVSPLQHLEPALSSLNACVSGSRVKRPGSLAVEPWWGTHTLSFKPGNIPGWEDYAGPFWGSLHPNQTFHAPLKPRYSWTKKTSMRGGGQGDEDRGAKSAQPVFSVGYREQRSPSEMRQIIAPRRSRTNTICSR